MQIAYNLCNLPQSITTGNGTSVNYGYLSDGTKYRAVSDSGEKYLYAGSLRFRIDNNNVVPESFAIAGGRVTYNGGSWQTNYYITDHLGCVRAVTDAMGNVLAEFDYTSYGELLSATDNTATGIDRLFTGKEQQGKLGASELYDSHARFMNTTGRFLSMDPLAEKYYHLSPYAYCAGDPVNLVDPDGRKIIINDGTKIYTWNNIDNQWGFYDAENNIYSGGLEYIHEYSNALKSLIETETGYDLVTKLANDDEFDVYLYSKSSLGNKYSPEGKYINWIYNDYCTNNIPTESGPQKNKITSLGHELAHAVFQQNGGDWKTTWEPFPNHFVSISEIYTTHIENKIRSELGLPLRTHYLADEYGYGVGECLLIDGKSLFYDVNEQTNFRKIFKEINRYTYIQIE